MNYPNIGRIFLDWLKSDGHVLERQQQRKDAHCVTAERNPNTKMGLHSTSDYDYDVIEAFYEEFENIIEKIKGKTSSSCKETGMQKSAQMHMKNGLEL